MRCAPRAEPNPSPSQKLKLRRRERQLFFPSTEHVIFYILFSLALLNPVTHATFFQAEGSFKEKISG